MNAPASANGGRPSRSRMWSVSLVALLLPGSGMWFWSVAFPERLAPNERRLPDGSILKIEKLTWGTTHELAFSQPVPLSNAREQHELRHYGHEEELVIWMSRRRRFRERALDFDWWHSSSVVDAAGVEISDRGAEIEEIGRWNSARGGPRPLIANRDNYHAWVARSSFPGFTTRRGCFRLNVINTSGTVVATFELKHPRPTRTLAPSATAVPLAKLDVEAGASRPLPRNDFLNALTSRGHENERLPLPQLADEVDDFVSGTAQ